MQQTETFFIQVPPGLEQIALQELNIKYPFLKEAHVASGGIELEASWSTGLSFNSTLKIPNRILLRLTSFKCRDLPKLYNKIKKMDWRFFNMGQEFNFFIASHESRVFDDRKIKKTLSESLYESFRAYPPKKKHMEKLQSNSPWNFFCRFEHDLCTLSLGLSGERLSKRGYKQSSGRAPLRENIAAALWLFMTNDLTLSDHETLLDPFAGSGTLLCEALLFHEQTITRTFSSQAFIINPSQKITQQESTLKVIGIEQDEKQYHCLKKNVDQFTAYSQLICRDNNTVKHELISQATLIMTNPPYNKRVKKEEVLFWRKDFQARRIGILLPVGHQPVIDNYKVQKSLRFSHGGIPVQFSVYQRL